MQLADLKAATAAAAKPVIPYQAQNNFSLDDIKSKPSVIIAHTVKGKGVSFMEGKCAWHGKAPNKEQLAQALAELK